MRPQHLAADNRALARLGRSRRVVASMRPQHLAADNDMSEPKKILKITALQ